MKRFTYRARNDSGGILSGEVESFSDKTAARVLQERGLLVVSLSEKRVWEWKNITLGFFGPGVSQQEIATFTDLLATMLSAGLPLTDALENLSTQTRNAFFREVIQTAIHDVQSGVTLSEALGRYPQLFDGLYLNLIKAGEASGKMDETMTKLAEMMASNLEFSAKVKGAMVYPAVVVTAMSAIGIFMITTIIPKIAAVYKEFGAQLPLPTRILLGLASIITNYFLLVAIVLILAVFFVRALMKNPTSEYIIRNLFLKIPIAGSLAAETTLTISARTLGMLLYSGIGILDALRIVAKAIENNYFRAGLLEAAILVEKGLPLSLAIRRNEHFPLIMAQLLAIGEETGTIDQSFLKLAKFYQDITERKVKTITTLLEPLMILMMGLMVGGLAIAVLLPMFNLVNVIK